MPRYRVLTVIAAALLVLPVTPAAADHTAAPEAVSVPGSHNSEMGCPGDWQPDCAQAQLVLDPADGLWKGTYAVPAGTYQYKAAINGSWDENYGAGGVPGGADITYTTAGDPVSFSYDPITHVVTTSAVGPPDLRSARAQWLRRDVLAFDAPVGATDFRLFHAPEGGLAATDEGVTGGESLPLTLAGLPPELVARYPHLAAYEALRVPATAVGELLTGQLVVAAFDADGRLVDATGVQIPGVLDDLYAGAAGQTLGPVWRHGKPSLALWAPTAKDVDLVLGERRVPMTRDGDGVWHARGERNWRDARYAFAVTVYVPALDDVVTNVVTDPYSLALTTNSARSVLVDLADPALAPKGWDRLRKPALPRPEDSTI